MIADLRLYPRRTRNSQIKVVTGSDIEKKNARFTPGVGPGMLSREGLTKGEWRFWIPDTGRI